MKLHKHFYIAIILLAVSAAAGEVYFRTLVGIGAEEAVPLSKPLWTIPMQLGKWEGVDRVHEIDPAVLLKIGSKDLLRRDYGRRAPSGRPDLLRLYVVYFGGIRGMAPHSPDVCMPGGGWSSLSSEIVPVRMPGFGTEKLRVHKDVFEDRDLRKVLVVWWEYIHGSQVTSRSLQRILWALPPGLGGRRGAVLQVQISHSFDGEVGESMKLIEAFMKKLGPHIAEVLPGGAGNEETRSPND